MIYAFCYLFLLVSYFLGRLIKYDGFIFVFWGMVPSVLTVVLRGQVGVDTAAYYINYQKILAGSMDVPFEPFFAFLVVGFGALFGSADLVQVAVSCSSCLFIILLFFNIDRKGDIFVLMFYPVFFFELTMNAIRFGLAFALWGLGLFILYKGARSRGLFLMISSVALHISSLALFFLAFIERVGYRRIFYLFVALLPLGWLFFGGRVVDKALAYAEIDAPSFFSGVVPYLLSLLFLAFHYFFERNRGCLFVTLFALYTLGFLVSKFTYAGIRLQWLFLAFAIVYFCLTVRRAISGRWAVALSLLGFMGFIFNYRYYIDGFMQGASPFLPYHFMWD